MAKSPAVNVVLPSQISPRSVRLRSLEPARLAQQLRVILSGYPTPSDIDKNRCEGEVMDLSDASFVTSTVVKDAKKASMIIITAGAKQRQGGTLNDH
eukprot:958585-Amorphochlora_amoeboformis.AAC.1